MPEMEWDVEGRMHLQAADAFTSYLHPLFLQINVTETLDVLSEGKDSYLHGFHMIIRIN